MSKLLKLELKPEQTKKIRELLRKRIYHCYNECFGRGEAL